MTVILIGGALVTKTGSGLGCGRSWPFCNGQIIPDVITPELIIEMSHRICTLIGGFLVLTLAISSWKYLGNKKESRFLALVSVIFILVQAGLGAGAVLWGQNDFIMALHFGVSLISFSAVFLLTLLIFEIDMKWRTDKLLITTQIKRHTISLLIYMYLVIYTGALVRHTEATLACLNFPFAGNGAEMPTTLPEWVQIGHRVAAVILFFWIMTLMIRFWRKQHEMTVLRWGWTVAFMLICLQAISGVLNVVTKVNLYITLSHSLFITITFGIVCYLTMIVIRKK